MHIIGLCLTIALSFAWFTQNAIDTKVELREKIVALFSHQGVARDYCTLVSQLNNSTYKVTDVPPVEGRKIIGYSYQPIYDQFVFSSCDATVCMINLWSVNENRIQRSFKAIDGQGLPRADIDNIFFDLEHDIISYTTPSQDTSSRIVVDIDGKLLQSIDETPGIDRTLMFQGYVPQDQLLVYKDNTTGTYSFYHANSISLSRHRCP
jgi:hypothetical protein